MSRLLHTEGRAVSAWPAPTAADPGPAGCPRPAVYASCALRQSIPWTRGEHVPPTPLARAPPLSSSCNHRS